MQIQCVPILKVIFVLSTIVAVTDCCSSRILLLRQHTLQIEERVVQLVNQLELHQQLNGDEQTNEMNIFTDTAKLLQVLPELDLDGKLATMVTTERESNTQTWSNAEETTSTPTSSTTTTLSTTIAAQITSSTATTPTTTHTMASTITMATGEPPPDVTTTEVLNLELQDDDMPTTTIATTTPATTTTTTTTTLTSTGTSTPKSLDELSFKLPCTGEYIKYFCLNGGNCFRWASANSFSYCVCADGYVGERCDSKTENGVYVPLRPTTTEPQMKTAHIVFSFPMLVLLSTIYVVFGAIFMFRNVSAQRRKQQQQQLHMDKQRFFVSC